MFRVNDVEHYAEAEVFEQESDAEGAAVMMSYSDDVIAIWDDATADGDVEGEVIALVYQQVVYRP